MTDYYDFFGLRRQASDDEIAKAYRRYALAYNPECAPENPNQAELQKNFLLAAQAYTVLSNPKARAIYDIYGEEGVLHGGTGTQGIPGGLPLDKIDPVATFRRFFGVDNPFQVMGHIDGVRGNQQDFYSQLAAQPRDLPKCPVMEVVLHISLEEVFHGATRRVEWVTSHPSGNVREGCDIHIAKGSRSGDRFVVEGKGNGAQGYRTGDAVVVLVVEPHDRYQREGDDLIVPVVLPLVEALCGTDVVVKSMDGEEVEMHINGVTEAKQRFPIERKGLPCSQRPMERGALIVECEILFPRSLTHMQKTELRRILIAQHGL